MVQTTRWKIEFQKLFKLIRTILPKTKHFKLSCVSTKPASYLKEALFVGYVIAYFLTYLSFVKSTIQKYVQKIICSNKLIDCSIKIYITYFLMPCKELNSCKIQCVRSFPFML